jgi:hypothetical protein
MIEKLSNLHDKTADSMRSYIELLEYRKAAGQTVKVSVRCEMCKLSVYGNIHKHRTNPLHLKLKNFIHPSCDLCSIQFDRRIDWDKHKLTSTHLEAMEKSGKTGEEDSEKDYFVDLDMTSVLKTPVKPEVIKDKSDGKTKKELTERIAAESAQLALDKIGSYEMADFTASKSLGKCTINSSSAYL